MGEDGDEGAVEGEGRGGVRNGLRCGDVGERFVEGEEEPEEEGGARNVKSAFGSDSASEGLGSRSGLVEDSSCPCALDRRTCLKSSCSVETAPSTSCVFCESQLRSGEMVRETCIFRGSQSGSGETVRERDSGV